MSPHSFQVRASLLAAFAVAMLAKPAIGASPPNGMQRLGSLVLSDSTNSSLYCAAIDTTNGFAYFGGKHFITKVDIKGPLPVEIGSVAQGAQIAAVIDVAAGYGFFCSGSTIYRIALGTGNNPPTLVDSLTLSASIWGAVIDTSDPNTANHYIYCAVNGTPVSISKVSVGSFTQIGSVTLNAGENSFRRGIIDTQNGFCYFVGPISETAPPVVVKIALGSGANAPSRIGAVQLDTTNHGMGSAVIDVANGFGYFGTYFGANSVPATVYKVALGTGNAAPALVGSVTLSAGTGAENGPDAAERELCTAVIDTASGNAYFGTDHTYAAKIFQIALGSGNAAPTETGMLQLNGGTHAIGEPNGPNDGENVINSPSSLYGEVFLQSSVYDPTSGFAYFGTDGAPGMIVKVQIPVTAPTAPSITNGPPPSGTAGAAYNFGYTATGNPAATFSVSAGGLPPGLSLSSTGVLSGTPNTAGTFNGTVSANNGVSPNATQNFGITIASSNTTPPQFTSAPTASPSSAEINQQVAFSAAASDPNGGAVTLTWDFGDGTSAATGSSVSHSYTTAGKYTVTATATSSSGTSSSALTITVGDLPVITSSLQASATQNSAFNYQITATGSAPITFQAQNLPDGLSLSGSSIAGTPTVAGSVPITLSATNVLGTDTETLMLNIAEPAGTTNNPPTITSPASADQSTATVGQPVNFSVAATDPDGNLLSYTWDFGDGSTTLGANVSHTYSAPGIYTVSVAISDGTNTVTSTLNLVVNAMDTSGSNISADGWEVGPSNTFKITKGAMKFNFADDSKDTWTCSGTIPILKSFIPAGKTVVVLIGGMQKTFTLNAHGQSATGASKFQLRGKMKKGVFKATPAKFALSIKGEPLLNDVTQYGFANASTSKAGEHHGMPMIVSLDQTGYQNSPSMLYKAHAGKTGTATISAK